MCRMGRVYRAGSTHPSVEVEVSRLAGAQYGVFSREQLTRLGISKGMIQHRLAVGRWELVSRNVFRIGGSLPSWRQSLRAATLGWGDCARVSHRSSAAMWRLAGFEPGLIEVTVPRL